MKKRVAPPCLPFATYQYLLLPIVTLFLKVCATEHDLNLFVSRDPA